MCRFTGFYVVLAAIQIWSVVQIHLGLSFDMKRGTVQSLVSVSAFEPKVSLEL